MSTITLVQTSLLHLHYAHTIDSPTRHIYPEEKGGKKDLCTIFLRRGNTNMQNKGIITFLHVILCTFFNYPDSSHKYVQIIVQQTHNRILSFSWSILAESLSNLEDQLTEAS